MKNFFSPDCYATWGLTQNPFMVHALRADKMGESLLVGRDDEVNLVAKRLHKHGKITCLDGHFGVGKTSLVNVAAYQCFQAFLRGETQQLLIPLHEAFELKKNEDVDQLCERIFHKIANGLLDQRKHLQTYSLTAANAQHVDALLNSPIIQHITHSLGASVSAGGADLASTTKITDSNGSNKINTSSGFSQDGLEQLVKKWLYEIFNVEGNGGVVCVIDNLELLESGAIVRRTLEALRDRLFNVNGLRWVFCGANGVVHSLAASPRLGAFLNTPIIEVANITHDYIEPLIRARLKAFSTDSQKAEKSLPIRLEDLSRLYVITNNNLRDLLNYADDYCEQQFTTSNSVLSDPQKQAHFQKWLNKNSIESYRILSSRISHDAWVVLDIAMNDAYRGIFGVGDYGSFSSSSKVTITLATFVKWLRDLDKLGLISRSIDNESDSDDDGGFKRDIYAVTAKGAMIHYARLLTGDAKSFDAPEWLKKIHRYPLDK